MEWDGEGRRRTIHFTAHHIHPIVIVNTTELRRGQNQPLIWKSRYIEAPVDFTPSSRPQCAHSL